jgi:predicted nucleic acid-binding protein
VRLVIADTGPINYLILIGHIDLLPLLFRIVVLPSAVQEELSSFKAPASVRHWAANLPAWLEVRGAPLDQTDDALLKGIDAGEKAAIQLAASLQADLLLMDDREGVSAARRKGLRVTGTLGILDLAGQRNLADFAQAVERLRQTNFRIPAALLDTLLKKHAQNSGNV